MKTKNPTACIARIEPYIADTRRRSTGVIAANDRRASWPMRTRGGLVRVVTVDPPRRRSAGGLWHANLAAHYLQVHIRRTSGLALPAPAALRWPYPARYVRTSAALGKVCPMTSSPQVQAVTVGAGPVTPAEVVAVARAGAQVLLSEAALGKIRRGRRIVE